MRLLCDCGNSAIKVAEWHGGHLGDVHRVAIDPGELSEAMVGAHRVVAVASGSQALETVRQVLPSDVVLETLGPQLTVPDVGQYATMGHDRVVAGLAAWAEFQQPLVVVDGGTATTITAWVPDPASDLGVCTAGGLILPGALACARALTGAAPHLPTVEPFESGAHPLQTSTKGALGAALGIGYPVMVAHCVQRACVEIGAELVVATGGHGQRWMPNAVYRPDLVLAGLGSLL